MPRHVVELQDGDIAAIVVDDETNQLEIYDKDLSDESLLIVGYLSGDTRLKLAKALMQNWSS